VLKSLADILPPLVVAFVVAIVFAPVVIAAARRWGVLDRPRGYKAHAQPTPLLGGLVVAAAAFAGATWFAVALGRTETAALAAIAAGSALIVTVGLVDDILGMGPGKKFLLQLAAIASTGVWLGLLGVRLNLFLAWPSWPMIALTVLWIVGITNAFNFLDNMNGLCAGLGAIAAASLAVLNWQSGETVVALMSAALAGACLGFLPFNWPSARVFLGDSGSMFIGYMLACLSVIGVYTRGAEVPKLAVFSPLLVFAVPVLDVVLVVLLRLRAHRAPWMGDRRHLNHRLIRRGLRPRNAVLTLWGAAAGCGIVAVSLGHVGLVGGLVLIGSLVIGLGFLTVRAGTEGLS
jgi:UDP-GlcNAc:undecaprenyl-phosphate GlcNAc-1-phosphate transferase